MSPTYLQHSYNSKEVVEKREKLKKATQLKKSYLTQANIRKFKLAQNNLSQTFCMFAKVCFDLTWTEQIAYLQEKIDLIASALTN